MTVAELFDALWADYVRMTPQAERIHRLLGARGDKVQNDHVALRTYGVPGIDIAALAKPFEAVGYAPRDTYRFDDKKLNARYWQHPDATLPKIFISELCVGELSAPRRTGSRRSSRSCRRSSASARICRGPAGRGNAPPPTTRRCSPRASTRRGWRRSASASITSRSRSTR